MSLTPEQYQRVCIELYSPLSGPQKETLRKAILKAFPEPDDLEMHAEDIDIEPHHYVVNNDTYKKRVHRLLKWAEGNNKLIALLNKLIIENLDNLDLQGEIEQYSVHHLTQCSGIGGLTPETYSKLVQLHQQIEHWEAVLHGCQQTSSEIDAHRPDIVASLSGDEFAPLFKWLLVLRYWLLSLPSVETDQYCLLQFLEHLQRSPKALTHMGHKALTHCLESVQTELGYQSSGPSDSFPVETRISDYRVHGYCVIDIEDFAMTAGKLRYAAWLDVQVWAGDHCLPELGEREPLEQSSDDVAAFHDAGESSTTDCWTPQFEIIQQKLPGWIQRVNDHLLKVCTHIQSVSGCAELPKQSMTIEFCLPWKLLIESVDAWPWISSLGEQTMLGRKHRVVVRSQDRVYNREGLLLQLQKVPEPLSIEQWKQKIDVVKNFQGLRQGDFEQIAQDFRQREHLGLALTCPFCMKQHRAERGKLLASLLAAGVPIVVWSRDPAIRGLSGKLKDLLTREVFVENDRFNFDILLQEVHQQRRGRSRWGAHLALWCDEQPRIVALNQVLEKGQLRA